MLWLFLFSFDAVSSLNFLFTFATEVFSVSLIFKDIQIFIIG